MYPINTTSAVNNQFVAGDPTANPVVIATELDAGWANRVQNEIVNAIEGAGLALDITNNSQLLKAIQLVATAIAPVIPFWRVKSASSATTGFNGKKNAEIDGSFIFETAMPFNFMARTGFKNTGAVDQTITIVRPFVVADQTVSGATLDDVSKATFTSSLNTKWNGTAIVYSVIAGSGMTLYQLNGYATYVARALTAGITLAAGATGILDIIGTCPANANCYLANDALTSSSSSYNITDLEYMGTPHILTHLINALDLAGVVFNDPGDFSY
jgi:hypothetical protein